MPELAIGDMAPSFTGQNQNGDTISLEDYKGKKVILFFYPKDNTPGCTKEACSLRDGISDINGKNTVVIGVSPDDVKSHKKFTDKFDLPFDLLSDPDKKCIEAYQVWGEKMNYGKKYMGLIRTTYIIDENQTIIDIISKVNTSEHAEQVLEIL
ncbi:MAG: thioredoxin-dependent thiol peroxidase [Lentisphaeria bacterium]|nr:thioredoxin-dependent thiol peroxidase [Lentisphaeria bacterium]NQZ69220.1 thioredoxin-dependent thiol peroxidase [Lentisphaeria bacterium]